jgi:hypothetical protein
MNRFASIFVASAIAVASLIPVAAEAGSKTHTRTKIVGYSTSASWEYVDGDVGTFVNVIVTDNDVSGTGGRSEDAFVSLAISRYQISTGNVLLTGVAYVDGPSNFDFSIDKQLGTATLRVRDAIFQDDNSFTFFNVDMDLTWTATGEAYVSKSNDSYKEPGFRFRSHFEGTFRDAVASGSIVGKNTQFTPVVSTSGQLQFNRFGNMEVTTQTP